MTDPASDDRAVSGLGETLQSLSDAASSLGTDLTELNRAVDDLQASTDRCSETQRLAAESLTGAARNLSTASGANAEPGQAASPSPADD